MFLHGYELFQTGSCSCELVAGGLSHCRYYWWLRMILGGCRWFPVVSDGFGWFVVLVVAYYQHKGFSCSGKFKIRWKWSCLEVDCRDTLLFCRHVFTFFWQHELLSVLLTFCFNSNISCKTENWYYCPFHLRRFFLLTEAMLLIKYRKNSCEGVLS